jgi:hypothetical protein
MRFSFKTWLFENQRLIPGILDGLYDYKEDFNREFNFRIAQFAKRINLGIEDKKGEDAETVAIRSSGEKKSVRSMSIGGKLTGKEKNLEHPEFKGWNAKLPEKIEIRGESIPITPETIEDECRKYMRENKFDETGDFDFHGILKDIAIKNKYNDVPAKDLFDQIIRGHYVSRSGDPGRVMTHIYKDGGWMNKESEKRAKVLAINRGEGEKEPEKGQNSAIFNYFNSGWFDVAMLGVIMCRNRGVFEQRVASTWRNRLGKLVPNAKKAVIKKNKVADVSASGIEANIPQSTQKDVQGDRFSLEIGRLEDTTEAINDFLKSSTTPEDIKEIHMRGVSSRSRDELMRMRDWILEKDDAGDFGRTKLNIEDEMDNYWKALDDKIQSMDLAISGAATATGTQADTGRASMIAMLGKIREELTRHVDGFEYSTIIQLYEGYFKKFEQNSQSPFKGKKIADPKGLFQGMFRDAASKLFGPEHKVAGKGGFLSKWLTSLFKDTFYKKHVDKDGVDDQGNPISDEDRVGVKFPDSPTTPGHPYETFFRRVLQNNFVGLLDLTVRQLDGNTPGAYTKLVEDLKNTPAHVAAAAAKL